jgi:hypothetical protein
MKAEKKLPRTCQQCGKPENLTTEGNKVEFTDFIKNAPVHMDCIDSWYATKEITLSAEQTDILFNKVLFSAAAFDIGSVLGCVHISAGGGKLQIVATDGSRLAVANTIPIDEEKSFRVNLLAADLLLIKKAMKKPAPIRIQLKEENAEIYILGEFNRTVSTIATEYPHYEELFPKKFDYAVEIPLAQLLPNLKAADNVLKAISDRTHLINLTLEADTLKLSIKRKERVPYFRCEFEAHIAIKGFCDSFPLSANLNSLYLRQAVESFAVPGRVKQQSITLRISRGYYSPNHDQSISLRPVVIDDGSAVKHMLMPVRDLSNKEIGV